MEENRGLIQGPDWMMEERGRGRASEVRKDLSFNFFLLIVWSKNEEGIAGERWRERDGGKKEQGMRDGGKKEEGRR